MRPVWLALVLVSLASALPAQIRREVRGEIVKRTVSGLEIVSGAEVLFVETLGRDRTNDDGLFRLPLPDHFPAGARIELRVDHAGYEVFDPPGGQVRIPSQEEITRGEPIRFEMRPKGALEFLNDPHIVALLEKGLDHAREQARRLASLENQPPRPSLGPFLQGWADRYGFGVEEVQAAVDRWRDQVAHNEREDLEAERIRALAAFAGQEFGKAAEIFEQVGERERKRLGILREQLRATEARERASFERVLEDYVRAGSAYSADYEFRNALGAYELALDLIDRKEDPILWAVFNSHAGIASTEIAIRAEAQESQNRLEQAIAFLKAASEVYRGNNMRGRWAAVQNDLGRVLQEQGMRTTGEVSAKLVREAVAAYSEALKLHTPGELLWAETQNNLGRVLQEQALRATAGHVFELLRKAEEAFRAALKVFARDELLQHQLLTLNNLANVLAQQGELALGDRSLELFEQALALYREILKLHARHELPLQQRAQTQHNLGTALLSLSQRRTGDSSEHLSEAVEAVHGGSGGAHQRQAAAAVGDDQTQSRERAA